MNKDSDHSPKAKHEPVLSSAQRTLQSGPLNIDILAKEYSSEKRAGDKSPQIMSKEPKIDFMNRSISPINKFEKHEKKTPQGIVKKIMPEKLKKDPFEGMNVAAVSLDPRRPD